MPTVLLVEDEPDSAELMANILEMDGLHVIRARTGGEGLDLARAETVDVVLLDVMLPGLDGFDVCRRLRSDPRTAQLPIAFLSAKTRDEDRRAGLQAGADVYLTKPISRAALVSATRWLLDGRQAPKPDLTGLPVNDVK
jgi:DNA-binding response OmpR family regulator